MAPCSLDTKEQLTPFDFIRAMFPGVGCTSFFFFFFFFFFNVCLKHTQQRLVCTSGSDGTIQTFRIPSFMVHNQRSPALIDNRSYQPDRDSSDGECRPFFCLVLEICVLGSDGDALVTPPHTPRSITPRSGSAPM